MKLGKISKRKNTTDQHINITYLFEYKGYGQDFKIDKGYAEDMEKWGETLLEQRVEMAFDNWCEYIDQLIEDKGFTNHES